MLPRGKPIPIPETQSVFDRRAQRNVFRRHGVHQQSRLFARIARCVQRVCPRHQYESFRWQTVMLQPQDIGRLIEQLFALALGNRRR